MRNRRKKNGKNKQKGKRKNDRLGKIKRKKVVDIKEEKGNDNEKRLEVSFYGYRNIYLKDIHNFIVHLRLGKYIFKNELFDIKNNDCLNNLIMVIVPNLSNYCVKDISTDNVFNKLQRNNNFRKIHSESCLKKYYNNIILKALSVSVLKQRKKNYTQQIFNLNKYLLTKEQMALNKYPTENMHEYINMNDIEYVKNDKNIRDIKSYLTETMNSINVLHMNNDCSVKEYKKKKINMSKFMNNINNDQYNFSNMECNNENHINNGTIENEQNNFEKQNIFTQEHIQIYADILEKLIKASHTKKNENNTTTDSNIANMASSKKHISSEHVNNENGENGEDDENGEDYENDENGEKDKKRKKKKNEQNDDSLNHLNLGNLVSHKINEMYNENRNMDEKIEVNNHNDNHNNDMGFHGENMHKCNDIKKIIDENNSCNEENLIDVTNYGEFDLDNIYSIDCEMCETTNHQRELTKITVVDAYMNIIYDSYVIPDNKITNYLTLYSGINESTLENVTTKLKDVQEHLKKFLNKKSILIGHSLENDLHALKIAHNYVIDTSIIYCNSGYYPKPSLFQLSKKHLNIIMKRENGHNSIDDAKISMFLALKKMSEFDSNEFSTFYEALPTFFNKDNFVQVKNSILCEEDICYKYEKSLCIFDSKNKYIEERIPKNFLKNSFYCVCENDEECTENLIMNIKNENKLKNYILILRDYENLCNDKIFNCIQNVHNSNFKIEDSEKIFEVPSRVETNEVLKKISANIEKIYSNMSKNDVLILLSFNNNYLAEEKVKETYFLAKDIFYSNADMEEKINNIKDKINSLQKIINKKKNNNEVINYAFYEFQDLLLNYDKFVLNYLIENKNNDKNIYIINSLTNLKNILNINSKKKEFNGWFSLLLKN
ncbi:exoribonuclease, putative [Plasmodium reichenowi]|uniref:Exoribonuclease, putative n=1 Tax=Plasmodium reichenowi TaxID=5854 RepID=A0A060RXT7_PLARE|nr:exoribonuclease, putative [Plasmodium reichenowi]